MCLKSIINLTLLKMRVSLLSFYVGGIAKRFLFLILGIRKMTMFDYLSYLPRNLNIATDFF